MRERQARRMAVQQREAFAQSFEIDLLERGGDCPRLPLDTPGATSPCASDEVTLLEHIAGKIVATRFAED